MSDKISIKNLIAKTDYVILGELESLIPYKSGGVVKLAIYFEPHMIRLQRAY